MKMTQHFAISLVGFFVLLALLEVVGLGFVGVWPCFVWLSFTSRDVFGLFAGYQALVTF